LRLEIKTNVHVSSDMNDFAQSSVLVIDVVASSVGNKYNSMGWEEMRFISDKINVH